MKQILQNLSTGVTELADVPCPRVGAGQLLIRTTRSLISAGTERMLVEFGRANFIEKARQQPDKVRQVLDKVRTDGLVPTLEAVRRKLGQPLPLGYCNVGVVLELGEGAIGFTVGDRVASNGKHAEVVCVPENLCARIPDGVSDEAAAFTVIGAIALQGIRLAQPTLGEACVVTGLGVIGLVAVQLLSAHGCWVLGIDRDPARLELARRFGADTVDLSAGEDPVAAAQLFSRGRGVDAVIVAASTKSSEPIHQAALMCRKRGRIVLVGVTGLELSRADFYEKELTFQVSCSYGPGRYDPNYEEKGQDYPVGFVRWTAQRNFEAVLDMMAAGRLDVKPLISHRFSIERAEQAYELVGGAGPSLGILLEYPGQEEKPESELRRSTLVLAKPAGLQGQATVAFVGAGNYATGVLIPAFRTAGARLKTVASHGGVSALHAARKYGFEATTTDADSLFADAQVNIVVIATRHDSHARLVCQALRAGKHVFVEKPLCLTIDELAEIERVYAAPLSPAHASTPHPILPPQGGKGYSGGGRPLLMVGFNRRFAPQIQKMKGLLSTVREPKAFVMTVNAGAIPPEHWTQDPQVGGGRVIGEMCHFIDLLRFLAGTPITGWHKATMDAATVDTLSIQLSFADGSLGTVHYFANGSKSFPKERLEVFCAGRVLQLDNFRTMRGYGWPGFSRMNLWRQDKGQRGAVAAFLQAVQKGETSPIPFEDLVEVARVSCEVAERCRHGM